MQSPDVDDYQVAWGIDPSSSFIGIAVVDSSGDLLHHEQHATGLSGTKDVAELSRAMVTFEQRLSDLLLAPTFHPDVVVIEQLAVAQSLNTVRAIMYFESVAMTWAARNYIRILKPVATSMRKEVFGKGNFTKVECADIVRRHYGKTEQHLPTPRSKIYQYVFTDDECDATAYALYGHDLKLVD